MGHVGFGHMLAKMVLHGLIFGLIFKVLRSLTVPEAIGLVAAIVLVFWLFSAASRSRVR